MTEPLIIGRYMICDEIGAGGMAKVHLGRILGAAGFSRVVAIKRLHPSCAESDKFATMLIDEARIAARIRHPNVAPTLDVIRADGELLLIMEYVHGPSLAWLQSRLLERGEPIPARMAVRIALDTLAGLHAAHQAKSERGRPLGIVHRDISPQNILVGEDGVARVLDFGIAKAEGRLSFSVFGEIKGKLRYMSPEQLRGEAVDCRTDVFATGIVLWEMLAGRRLVGRPADGEPANVMKDMLSALSELRGRLPSVSPAVEEVVLGALNVDRAGRFASADEMAGALAAAADAATQKELGIWTGHVAADLLARRLELLERIEQVSAVGSRVVSSSPPPAASLPPTVTTGVSNTLVAPTASMNKTLPMPVEPDVATKAVLSPVARRMGAPDASATLVSFHQATPSSVESTVVSAAPRPRSSRKPYAAFVVVAALLVAVVAGGALAFRQARRGAASAPARSVTSTRTSEPPASAHVATQPPSPSMSTVTAGTPVEAATPAATASATAARPTPAPRRTRASAAPAKPSCDPPFTVDREGVRIPKQECVGD